MARQTSPGIGPESGKANHSIDGILGKKIYCLQTVEKNEWATN